MDLSNPITSVVPSSYGPVLVALVRAGAPLSGRQVAALVEGQVSRSRVNSVLGELADSGLALRESHPPSILYQFNRRHVAAEYIEALADLRQHLLERIRSRVSQWLQPADAVWMFGSAARGDGSVDSDIDILVVRPEEVDEEDPEWSIQLSELADSIREWTGNCCELLEMSRAELAESIRTEQKLVADLRRDAIPLGGSLPSSLLRKDRREVNP